MDLEDLRFGVWSVMKKEGRREWGCCGEGGEGIKGKGLGVGKEGG